MRRTLFFFLIIVTFYNVRAQKQVLIDNVGGESQINIAIDEVNKVFTPPANEVDILKSGTTGSFNVVYENFPDDAKAAFQYAIRIWEGVITSPVKINVLARWESSNTNMLAYSKPTVFYKNFEGAYYSNVLYPVALAEKLSERELNGSTEPDIICVFNKNISWYFGTDGNTPSTKYDFTTAVLHEITHGLGFSGFFSVENGNGLINNSSKQPSIYDYYIFNKNKQRISDNSVFSSPSTDLLRQLTSKALQYVASDLKSASNYELPNLYAPENWLAGSSLYHLDHTTLDSKEKNSLMTAFKYKGEAVHTPGEKTIEMLSEMGWKTISFNFEVLKDIEETCDYLPLSVGINSEIRLDSSSVKVIYSTNYFSSKDSIFLSYNNYTNQFTGNLPVKNHLGFIQYYIVAQSADNKVFSLPSNAPTKILSFRIGTDYTLPILQHNPVKIVSKDLKSMNLTAMAKDNLGINSVKVEIKVNGVLQDVVELSAISKDLYNSNIKIADQLLNSGTIEYRIIADDKSKSNNKVTLPSSGYYTVKVYDTIKPVKSYQNDFNSYTEDFITSDFDISEIPGFSNGILHSTHPYGLSVFENEKFNLIAQLRTPVIIQKYGQMSFKEVVLVEPGESSTQYNETLFWDYVIVEASKDNGVTWLPLVKGYDSNTDNVWYSAFKSKIDGNESMFLTQTIDLTKNTGLVPGDIAIFRFRLASDRSINGWGWAIDDLKIQDSQLFPEDETKEEIVSTQNFNVYPNPFAGSFYVDCTGTENVSTIDINVTDLTGKSIFRDVWMNPQYDSKKQINLNNLQAGIYLVNMVTDASQIITKKIVKY
jgi:hypothetical protein